MFWLLIKKSCVFMPLSLFCNKLAKTISTVILVLCFIFSLFQLFFKKHSFCAVITKNNTFTAASGTFEFAALPNFDFMPTFGTMRLFAKFPIYFLHKNFKPVIKCNRLLSSVPYRFPDCSTYIITFFFVNARKKSQKSIEKT